MAVVEIIPAEAYKQGSKSWVDLYPQGGRPMRVTHEIFGAQRGGLGVAASAAAGIIGISGAIGGLVGLLQNAMDDDWSDRTVFDSHAKTIHSAMLAVQCMIGGSEQAIRDLNGNLVCDSYMPPKCEVSESVKAEWRSLRDGFGQFWAEVAESWLGPSNAEAALLKQYARRFYAFHRRLAKLCRRQGVTLPAAPEAPASSSDPDAAPGWLKWGVLGVGLVTALIVAKTVKDVFGD